MNGSQTQLGAFVLGMHRSGTSAVTRTINLLGVPLNDRADWVPALGQDNLAGYWESASLYKVNDEILAALEGSWDVPPRFEPGWPRDPRLDWLRASAPDLCSAVLRANQWVWKDPRNCLTLSFWLDVLDVTPVFVLAHRSPVEVALSLMRRNAIPLSHSFALWERYVRSSLDAVAGRSTYVLDYARLLEDSTGVAADLRCFLASAGFDVLDADGNALRTFLSSELRHSSFPDVSSWAQFGVSPEQCALHDSLSSVAGAHQAFAPIDPGPETLATEALFQRLRTEREAVRTLEATVSTLRHVQERLGQLDDRLGLVEDYLANLTALQHRVDALERCTALRLLTAPGRLRSRISQRLRERPLDVEDGHADSVRVVDR
jgi:hypothetical protein